MHAILASARILKQELLDDWSETMAGHVHSCGASAQPAGLGPGLFEGTAVDSATLALASPN